MTNPILSNDITNSRVITWQYDKAVNLINLIKKWNQWATVSISDFWDNILYNVLTCKVSFKIQNVWSKGIVYKVGKEIQLDEKVYKCKKEHTSSDANKPPNNTYWDEAVYDSFALTIWGNILGIPRPQIIMQDGTKKYISDDLYYRLLHARFFLMYKSPTITNYNRYLRILFPANRKDICRCHVLSFGDTNFNTVKTVETKDKEGTVIKKVNVKGAKGTMSMGFTFPSGATEEEAMLIFQHYDVCYPFPASIRSNSSFVQTDLVIGLNDASSGQSYRNFSNSEEIAWATDSQNGGIISTTEGANYYVVPTVKGKAFVTSVNNTETEYQLTFSKQGTVWVDWGDGDNTYHSVSNGTTIKHTYQHIGIYAVAVYSSNGNNPSIDWTATKEYELRINE